MFLQLVKLAAVSPVALEKALAVREQGKDPQMLWTIAGTVLGGVPGEVIASEVVKGSNRKKQADQYFAMVGKTPETEQVWDAANAAYKDLYKYKRFWTHAFWPAALVSNPDSEKRRRAIRQYSD